jgi:hypothetical protein
MPAHAGFAAAVTIRERVLNDSLLLSYHAGNISHWLAAPLPDGPPDVLVNFFLEPPQIRCTGEDSQRLIVRLRGWGDMQLLWNSAIQSRSVRWEMQLLMHPRFVLAGAQLTLSPERDDVTLDDWQFVVLSGAPYTPEADLYLRGGIFRNRLENALGIAISSGLLDVPPIDVSFLGSIVEAATMDTTVRVLGGAIVVGLDIVSDTIVTTGNAQLLADFARNNDIAVITNPVAVPVTFRDAEAQIRDAVAQQGATLERLTIAVEEGRFRVTGRASKSAGAVNFSFVVIPVLFHSRPGAYLPAAKRTIVIKARSWPALGFKTGDVSVDVDKSTWVVIVEVVGALLTGAVIPLIIEDLVRGITRQITFSIKTQAIPPQPPPPRLRRLEPLVPGDPTVRLKIEEFEIHTDGVFTGITLRPEIKPPILVGLTSIPRNFINSRLKYEVRLPFEQLPDDPSLRVRWTIVDLDSGNILLNDDGLAMGRLELEFVPASLGAGLSRFGIMCRVYRTLGPEITDFLNDGIRLDVRPPLSPGAYVRWRYDVKNPQVQFNEDTETWWYAPDMVTRRWSAIHRTDRPCKMANRSSRYTYSTEFLDTLPFSLDQIISRRDQLCDYCFFGGPGRSLPSL